MAELFLAHEVLRNSALKRLTSQPPAIASVNNFLRDGSESISAAWMPYCAMKSAVVLGPVPPVAVGPVALALVAALAPVAAGFAGPLGAVVFAPVGPVALGPVGPDAFAAAVAAAD